MKQNRLIYVNDDIICRPPESDRETFDDRTAAALRFAEAALLKYREDMADDSAPMFVIDQSVEDEFRAFVEADDNAE